jgi:glycine/D-amino acid oxidase-like deaminating enzyme
MAASAPLNTDYERRPFWHATMSALPDRSGRDLPAEATVVVVGGGYAGITAASELARRGIAVTLLEAHTLGWGASTRNGGIVHAGYKWSARQLIARYGTDTGKALYQETLDSYELVRRLIDEERIDCDFREVGHLELAYAPAHAPELEHARESLASVGVRSTVVSRERIREEIGSDAYFGALAV